MSRIKPEAVKAMDDIDYRIKSTQELIDELEQTNISKPADLIEQKKKLNKKLNETLKELNNYKIMFETLCNQMNMYMNYLAMDLQRQETPNGRSLYNNAHFPFFKRNNVTSDSQSNHATGSYNIKSGKNYHNPYEEEQEDEENEETEETDMRVTIKEENIME